MAIPDGLMTTLSSCTRTRRRGITHSKWVIGLGNRKRLSNVSLDLIKECLPNKNFGYVILLKIYWAITMPWHKWEGKLEAKSFEHSMGLFCHRIVVNVRIFIMWLILRVTCLNKWIDKFILIIHLVVLRIGEGFINHFHNGIDKNF